MVDVDAEFPLESPFVRILKRWLFVRLPLVVLLSSIGSYYGANECLRYDLGERPAAAGPWAYNTMLSKAERILENQVLGPESFIVEGEGNLVASLGDGRIVELKNGKIIRDFRPTGLEDEKCQGDYDSEPTCGRPLGIRRVPDTDPKSRQYYVLDSYRGLLKVDLIERYQDVLIRMGQEFKGQRIGFVNDLDVLPDGRIVFSSTSPTWQRRAFMLPLLEQLPLGRVYIYEPKSQQLEVLAEGFSFTNGIQALPGKNAVLVADTGLAVIYELQVPSVGEKIVTQSAKKLKKWAKNLPGLPDNIRIGRNGTVWVGMASQRFADGKLSLFDALGNYPTLRRVLSGLVPYRLWSAIRSVGDRPGVILQFTTDGKPIGALHDDPNNRVVGSSSQVLDDSRYLYIGSFGHPYLLRLEKSPSQAVRKESSDAGTAKDRTEL